MSGLDDQGRRDAEAGGGVRDLDGDRAVVEAINADVYGGPLLATAALSVLAFVAAGIDAPAAEDAPAEEPSDA